MLIGLHGLSQAGKDTVCDIITKIYPETERRPHAEPVKEAAATFLGIDRELVEIMKLNPNYRIVIERSGNPESHFADISMRDFLRLIGHDGRRIFGEDIWINQNYGKLTRDFHWNRIVVVTDVRYDNEALAIRRFGGFIVQINRPGIERPDHGSEAGINSRLVDYTINNDKGLPELELAVHTLLQDIQTGKYAGVRSQDQYVKGMDQFDRVTLAGAQAKKDAGDHLSGHERTLLDEADRDPGAVRDEIQHRVWDEK